MLLSQRPPASSSASAILARAALVLVPFPITTAGVGAPVCARFAEENPEIVRPTSFATQSTPALRHADAYVTLASDWALAATVAGLPVTVPAYPVPTIGSVVAPAPA